MSALYFAYGSNMHTPRMRARAPSAESVEIGRLRGWRLACNKHGRDGSGKANLVPDPGREVWGVVYRLSPAELVQLDEVEQGYRRVAFPVLTPGDRTLDAEAYVSDLITSDPVPFNWYRELMVAGARHHRLPETHIAYLENLPIRLG